MPKKRMNEELFVQVAVENTVYHFDKLFTYRVPEALKERVAPGVRVSVPFGSGNRRRVGLVFSLTGEGEERVKDVDSILDQEPSLEPDMLELARWMKERYYCTLFEAAKLMIPAGYQFRLRDSYVLSPDFKDFDRESYTDAQWRLILCLRRAGKSLPLEKIVQETGLEQAGPVFKELTERGVLCKVNTAMSRVKDATSKMVRPVPGFSGKLTPRQKDVYQTLLDAGEASERERCYFTGASSSVVRALVEKGAAEAFEYEVYRRPDFFLEEEEPAASLELSPSQEKALQGLIQEYHNQEGCRTALLYGVTGSGKTSVFLKLIQHVRDQGKGVIVMVPEISLTAQTIRQFRRWFGDGIALFHSGLSLGERLDEWKRVRRGKASIVVGTRSAVFAPVRDLGLIVLDEEQEHTYKSESSPRYDAREVARYRCWKAGAFCLLSSATPSVETCRLAQEKKVGFHRLSGRFGQAVLPQGELVDMNQDAPPGETSFGATLSQALRENFQAGRQSILLLNRRGYHTFASCKTCHQVVSCPHCSISLTYHSANGRLMCHYCGYSIPFSRRCPSCGSDAVAFHGAGTQKAEEQLQELLPEARVLRIDTDSVAAKYSLEKKLDQFARGEYDVMVGTQMVAKGLDFENVTLVGVLSADQSLFSDDFRSNERTFDLLTQVVGRAGRGKYPGRAIIQTYAPENPVLHLAAQQDYFGFYRQEILFRQAMLYPPFVDILVIGFVGGKEPLVRQGAETFLRLLGQLAQAEYADLPLRVLRPSPAAVAKVSNKYRYKLLIKCRSTSRLREMISRLLIQFSSLRDFQQVTAYADPNPYRIL